HTPDSICLFDGHNLFTGDTLFIGNCGRTDLPGGSTAELFRSLHTVLMALPSQAVIYPGHDYGEVPSRTLGEEVKLNPTLRARDLRDFAGVE
ncbi:MAG: MBL fold metallo-hydrolase, partial [Nitrososphaerales archaeon]